MMLLLYSTLVYTVLASNYIIDTPPGQINDDKMNWAYPMDVCIPNQLVSRGITSYIKYKCQQNDDNTYAVIKNSYNISDTTCDNVMKTKTFSLDTNPGLPGYFVCDNEKSEYAIINVYDNDPECTTNPIPLYSAIGTSENLCFKDRTVYVSLFECFDGYTNALVDSYVKQTTYEDDECTITLFGSTIKSSDCQVIGTMDLNEDNGGHTVIYGKHNSCKYDNNQDDESIEKNVLFDNDINVKDIETVAVGIGYMSSVVIYVGLIIFLFLNGIFCLCYLYTNKDHDKM